MKNFLTILLAGLAVLGVLLLWPAPYEPGADPDGVLADSVPTAVETASLPD